MRLFHLRVLFAIFALGLLAPYDASAASALRPQRWVTPNGSVVLLMEQPSLPVVSVRILIRGGSVLDLEDRAGLAYVTAQLLDEGTALLRGPEIAEALDFLGAQYSVSAQEDYVSVGLKILKKDAADGLRLLGEVVMKPSFPPAEVERKKNETLGALRAEQDDPGTVAEKAFNRLVFGAHPYHRPVNGTEETVARITRDDIVSFHGRVYRANNAIIAIVGAVDRKEAVRLLDLALGGWKPGPPPPRSKAAPVAPGKAVVERIDRHITQANIILGHVGIQRSDPDYYAVSVMNYILGGGGFSSRMVQNIRDNRGLAYSVNSFFDARLEPGSFAASLQTQNKTANDAIREVLAEIRKIRSAPVSDGELEEAKSFLIGSFPLRLDTNDKLANLLPLIELYGLGLDYLDKYPEYIRRVTKEDVQRVAKRYLDPERFVLVVVADQAQAQIVEPKASNTGEIHGGDAGGG